ncbi:MAG TPA: arginase [Nitrolancea sp.]|nr:arginase [Nitrolancea sp.]
MAIDTSANWLVSTRIQPILVPLALGSLRSGVEQGSAVLDARLRARWLHRGDTHLLARLGESLAIPVDPLPHTDQSPHPGQALFAHEIALASRNLADRTRETINRGELALTLGGDHAVAIGSVAGAALACHRLAVIWVDAHGDLNWPDVSPSGRVHGMPLGVSLGRGLPELTAIGLTPEVRAEDTYLLGVRSLDPAERSWIHEGAITCVTTAEIDDVGLDAVIDRIVASVAASQADAVHLSFDVDVLDPLVMPGTGSLSAGGLTLREAAHLLRRFNSSSLPIHSLDWVELNPALDPSGGSEQIAARLLAVALGEDAI